MERVVFSAPQKISRICPRVNAHAGSTTKHKCTKNHAKQFLPCTLGIIYKISLLWGKSDIRIGRTGGCLSDRLRVHYYFLKATAGGRLPIHCREGTCRPLFGKTNILEKNDKLTCKVLEAFYSLCEDRNSISVEFVTL